MCVCVQYVSIDKIGHSHFSFSLARGGEGGFLPLPSLSLCWIACIDGEISTPTQAAVTHNVDAARLAGRVWRREKKKEKASGWKE